MLSQLDIFYGSATPQRAMLYARLPREGIAAGATLRGTVTGPECELAATLPVKVDLQDMGEGNTLLARAVIPDPVFWSAKLPARYRLDVELCQGEEVLAREERLVGIRALGVVGADLRQESKRIVLRMVHQGEVPTQPITAWKEHSASMFAIAPPEIMLEEASRIGVTLALLVQGNAAEVTSKLRAIARHAAVSIAIIDGNHDTPVDQLRDAAPNLLLFQPMSPDEPRWKPAPWAQGVTAPVINPTQFALGASLCELPILAARPQGPAEDLGQARAACDHLQRDLATYCQCAGYIV